MFLKLGTTAFGGPAAHIAMMEAEVVRRRRWLSESEFLDLLAAANLVPGPNSTELALHIGHRRAGWRGLLVAGACFILPAMLIVLVFAYLYQNYGALPRVQGLLRGVKPVILAVIAQAVWYLGRATLRTPGRAILTGAAFTAATAGVAELPILLAAGVLNLVGPRATGAGLLTLLSLPRRAAWAAVVMTSVPFGMDRLFFFFLKVGSILYGSGYVLIAFLRTELVERTHWLTETQLLDAVAVGQFTPGPVFTTATFIGYVLAGVGGAVTATVGIFLPSFVFVAGSGSLMPRLRRSARFARALDGVNAASLGLLAAVTVSMGREVLVDSVGIGLAVASAALLVRYRLNSSWLIVAGAALGSLV